MYIKKSNFLMKGDQMRNFLFFGLIILTQCGWSWGWQEALTPNYIIYPGTPSTTNQTLSNGQSGNVIVFTGTLNNTRFTLPSATLGLDFTIIGDVAKYMKITPQSADIINFSTLVAGDSVSNSASSAKGDSIELVCQTNGQWSIKNRIGTWAKDN